MGTSTALYCTGGSTCKPGGYKITWLAPNLQKEKEKKKSIYTLAKNILLYAKLIYRDYLNKNVEHPDLRIIKIWVQQK